MKTIAVTSGKGGVGKSSLSANLGVALSKLGYRTVIFDADLALANLEVLLGTRAEFSLQHVVAEEKTLSEVVAKGPEGVGLIAGGSGIPVLMRSGPKKLNLFFDQVQDLSNSTDVLIFDTSAGIDNKVMSFVKASDEVLLVTTPEPASVTDAYATIKTVFRNKKDAVVNVVVNMVTKESEAKEVFDILSRITKDFTGHELHYAGYVRKDDNVGLSARARKPLVQLDKKSIAAVDMTKLASKLAPGEALSLELAS